MLKSRTRNAALKALLSVTLCAGLVPIAAVEARADELVDGRGEGSSLVGEAAGPSDMDAKRQTEALLSEGSSDSAELSEGSAESAAGTGSASASAASAAQAEAATNAAREGSAFIERAGGKTVYRSLIEAVDAALDGETVVVAGEHVLDSPLAISDGRSIVLRAEGPARVTRAAEYPQVGGKPAALVKLSGGSSLAVKADSADEALSFDGESKDSDEAIVVVDGRSAFSMEQGAVVENAHASRKPWGGVYVRSGSFVLDGGKIADGLAQKNAAVAVEAGSSFDMRSGEISGNRSTYSEAAIWSKGSFKMSGGSIVGNAANSGASRDGVVYVLGGGTFAFTGGEIGGNDVPNSCGVYVDSTGFSMGASARLTGSDRIVLKGSASIGVSSGLTEYSVDNPLRITLLDSWGDGRVVAKFPSAEEARRGISYIEALTGGQTADSVPVLVDSANDSWVSVASGDAAALFELLDDPYADNLGLSFKSEFLDAGAFEQLRARLDRAYGGADSPDKRARLARLEYIERQIGYVGANRAVIEASAMQISELGDPAADRSRTKQNFQFDNLDATGYYLKPGQVNELYFYVDADDPSLISLAWRQAGLTENEDFSSLNLSQRTQLENGVNRVVVDLTGKQYGYMLFVRNDSTSNAARVRLEAADANVQGKEAIIGTQLGTHPVYLHDTEHPERFWGFVQEVREHVALVQAGKAQDMALLQMGNEGRAQFSIRATALDAAYAGIDSPEAALSYVERSNAAIQERLEFYWSFDGFDKSEDEGANAVSRMRVHTAFTKNVKNPSNMYATGRYFHMPEGSAANFLSGKVMYGWGMSHEYGHVLDNSVLVVNEETNNMYSIAGSRNGEILASKEAGRAFNASSVYHPNAMRAEKRWNDELRKMAEDESYVPDWNADGWGYYIWAHLLAWWNGTHFFDEWDYSGYDHESSPFTKEAAQEVGRWGAFGATMRILRADAEAVSLVEKTTASISDGTSRKYNRIAMAYTMGTGYNFAEYLETMGQRDLSDEVKQFCGQYPSMPRKVQYYSLSADAAQINGAKPYKDGVKPDVSIEVADGTVSVKARMSSEDLASSTIAFELYRNGELVGFSRDGSFSRALEGKYVPGEYSVVSYDVRLNPSERAYAPGEEPPMEDAPEANPPAEDAPEVDAPAEDVPGQENPEVKPPAQETPGEEEPPAADEPSDEAEPPTGQQPSPEPPAEDDRPSEELPGEDNDSTEEPPAVDSWTNPYEDMEEGDWFFDDVKAMWERDIMTGVGESLFDPRGTTTRAMAVTTIWRMAGKPSATSDASFADVNGDEWHAEAVRWAASAGVAMGYGDTGTFGPDDQVTREQFATLLARYAKIAGFESSQPGDLSSFADSHEVSDWGAEGLAWAVGEGIVRGVDGTHLMPSASAQRCELAAMLNRCLGRYGAHAGSVKA